MKFTIFLPLAFAALGLAAPALEKRVVAQVTLFKGVDFTGQSTVLVIDTDSDDRCYVMPSGFDNSVSSVKLDPTVPNLYCRVVDSNNCVLNEDSGSGVDSFFFSEDNPDLGTAAGKGSSIFCALQS